MAPSPDAQETCARGVAMGLAGTPGAAGTRLLVSRKGRPRRLHAGFVTFVMTDIEGSTRLFRELGERYVELLATHQALLRSRFTKHGGVEVGTEGDSLFFA